LEGDCDVATGCTYTGADDGTTLCDLDSTTDNTNACASGCVYTPEVVYTPATAEVEEVEYVPFRAEFCVPTDGSRVARSTSEHEIAELDRGVPEGEIHCELVVATCVQGDMNTLGSDTQFEPCSQPQTPEEYVVFQAPGEWVTDRCVPGDMHTLGVDTQMEDCQIRETPMQETRLREHGTGKDGPVYVGPGATATLNEDRYSTHSNFEEGSYYLRLLVGQGAFETDQMAMVHQTRTGEASDYEVGTWEFAVVHGMVTEPDCSVGGPVCSGTADDGMSVCDLLEVTDGTAECAEGCTLTEDPCSFLAPAGRWQQAFDSNGVVKLNDAGEIECVPNQLVSYLRVAQPLTNAYSTNVEVGDYAQVVRVDEVTSVTIEDGGTLTVNGWNGRHGGIMAFLATGILDVRPGGEITSMGTGYRGVLRQSVNLQVGDQGEGMYGFGDKTMEPLNVAGGGGDKDQLVNGQYCSFGGGGGGGGHATPGLQGFPGGLPSEYTGTYEERLAAVGGEVCAYGGSGGGTIPGNENQTKLYFGGAGGQGGADDDGYGSAGGNGGGVLVAAVTGVDIKCACVEKASRSVDADAEACAAVELETDESAAACAAVRTAANADVAACTYKCGQISSNGEGDNPRIYNIQFGGGGSGGGGGGAGGAVFLRVDTAKLRCGAVSLGGTGGLNTGPQPEGPRGGTGGMGRVTIQQLKGTSAFPILVNTPIEPDSSDPDSGCVGEQEFPGLTFRPTWVTSTCNPGSMYREGLDTQITLCSLDPFRNPTVVLPDEACDETAGPPESCKEAAKTSVTADAAACAAVVLGTETTAAECQAVPTAEDSAVAACVYTAASATTVDADAQACTAVVLGEETSGDDCAAVMTTASVCLETATETSFPKSNPDDKYACESIALGTATSEADCEAVMTIDDPSVPACTYGPISACTYTPKPRTGCVIRGCQEGYWNATGADAELFECYVPVDEFVTSVCTKSVGHCWESTAGPREAQGPIYTDVSGPMKPVVCEVDEIGDPCLGDDTKVSTCSEPGRCIAATDGGYAMYPTGKVYRDGSLGRPVGRADGRVSACGEHAATCSGIARATGTVCDLRGLTDSTFECLDGCAYTEKPCKFLGGGVETWATYVHPDYGEYCAPHTNIDVDEEGLCIKNRAECEATPGNVWELTPVWVTDPCDWGDAQTAGTDTQFADCSYPVAENLEYVRTPCRSGNIWDDGEDTDIQTCSEPTPGVNYVAGLCVTGDWNQYGRDTVLLPCTDTSDLADGTFISAPCVPGSSTELGSDSMVDTCSLPNGVLPSRMANGAQLHTEANNIDHSCAMLVSSKCTGTADEVIASCTGTAGGEDAGKICDLDEGTDDSSTCPLGCARTGRPQCTGSDDGSGAPATCTGTADGNGGACELNGDSTGCAVAGGDCVYAASTPGAACALTADSTACAVEGGDCVFTALASYTPLCDFDPNTDGVGSCPAGCASTSGTDPCQQGSWRSFGTGADRYCAPFVASDAEHESSCTTETCGGTADEVAATCTGTATGGEVCDLDASTDGTDACPAGCASTDAFTPICDLDLSTDDTDLCPSGCISGVLTDGAPTETWRATELSHDELGTTYLAPFETMRRSVEPVALGRRYGQPILYHPWVDDHPPDNSCHGREVAALNAPLEAGAVDCASLLPVGRWFSCERNGVVSCLPRPHVPSGACLADDVTAIRTRLMMFYNQWFATPLKPLVAASCTGTADRNGNACAPNAGSTGCVQAGGAFGGGNCVFDDGLGHEAPPEAPLDCAHMAPYGRWHACKDATGAVTCVPRPKVLGGQWTQDACAAGSSVAAGADTVIAECSLPKFFGDQFEFVSSVCTAGDHTGAGSADTQFSECTEPVDGQWTSTVCDHGTWDVAGADTAIDTCTDTADVADGDYIEYNCEKGSAAHLGTDSVVSTCSLPECHYFVAEACEKGAALSHGSDSVIVGCTQPPLHQYMMESLPWVLPAETDDLVWSDGADYSADGHYCANLQPMGRWSWCADEQACVPKLDGYRAQTWRGQPALNHMPSNRYAYVKEACIGGDYTGGRDAVLSSCTEPVSRHWRDEHAGFYRPPGRSENLPASPLSFEDFVQAKGVPPEYVTATCDSGTGSWRAMEDDPMVDTGDAVGRWRNGPGGRDTKVTTCTVSETLFDGMFIYDDCDSGSAYSVGAEYVRPCTRAVERVQCKVPCAGLAGGPDAPKCTGTDDGAGNACALNSESSGCVRTKGVDSGSNCVFTGKTCDLDASTGGTAACPLGCDGGGPSGEITRTACEDAGNVWVEAEWAEEGCDPGDALVHGKDTVVNACSTPTVSLPTDNCEGLAPVGMWRSCDVCHGRDESACVDTDGSAVSTSPTGIVNCEVFSGFTEYERSTRCVSSLYADDDFDPSVMCCACLGGDAPIIALPDVDRDSCTGTWEEGCVPRSFDDDRGDDYVVTACVAGGFRGGSNSVIEVCSLPVTGQAAAGVNQFVGSPCLSGSWDTDGCDTVLEACTDTLDLLGWDGAPGSYGTWITDACVPGEPTVVGLDSQVEECTLPNVCTAPTEIPDSDYGCTTLLPIGAWRSCDGTCVPRTLALPYALPYEDGEPVTPFASDKIDPYLVPFASPDCETLPPAGSWQMCAGSCVPRPPLSGCENLAPAGAWRMCDGVCVPMRSEAKEDTSSLLDDYVHYIGEFSVAACNRGTAMEPGSDTVVKNCSLTDGTDYVSTLCEPGSHLAGQDTGLTPCLLPDYGQYAALPCVPGNIFEFGIDTVPWHCSPLIPGTYAAAPCRRYGGMEFESTIYLPGRDTQPAQCTPPDFLANGSMRIPNTLHEECVEENRQVSCDRYGGEFAAGKLAACLKSLPVCSACTETLNRFPLSSVCR
jgi:hypothetical protein